MANVHSVTMFSGGPNMSTGTTTSAAVPAGFVWVIKEILALNQRTGANFNLRGIQVQAPATLAVIFNLSIGQVVPFIMYRQECRVVLQPGQTLAVVTQEANWSCVISGYQLTLP